MFDIALRPLKDGLFEPLSRSVPAQVNPLQVTGAAFICGLISCISATANYRILSLIFWALNRGLDCLDGALARHRKQQSDLGGFLDLLGDFTVYALIPIACARSNPQFSRTQYEMVALLEAAFWINNFVLFYIAAHIESKTAKGLEREAKEVTSLAMRPALIEGFESGVFFTLMLAMPQYVGLLSLIMFVGVVFGTGQRTQYFVTALQRPKTG